MKEKLFSIGEVLKEGWEGWKKNWGVWLGAVAITAVLGSVGNLGHLFKDSKAAEAIFQVLGVFLGIFATLGIIYLALRTVRGLDIKLTDFFDTFPYYWRFFIGQLLYGIAIGLGLLLFIVPGIILGMMFYLFPYYIIEKNLGVIDAFKASSKAVYGSKGNLFLFSIVGMLLNILGIICFVVGLFVSIPVVAIAQAAIYRILSSRVESAIEEKH